MSDPVSKADLSRQLRQTLASLNTANATIEALLNTLSTGLKPTVKDDLKADHRRAHKRGIPAKIDANPDLRAFIIARLETHTFTAICAEAAAHFPPDRRTSVTALSRWWQREGKHSHLAAEGQDHG